MAEECELKENAECGKRGTKESERQTCRTYNR